MSRYPNPARVDNMYENIVISVQHVNTPTGIPTAHHGKVTTRYLLYTCTLHAIPFEKDHVTGNSTWIIHFAGYTTWRPEKIRHPDEVHCPASQMIQATI